MPRTDRALHPLKRRTLIASLLLLLGGGLLSGCQSVLFGTLNATAG